MYERALLSLAMGGAASPSGLQQLRGNAAHRNHLGSRRVPHMADHYPTSPQPHIQRSSTMKIFTVSALAALVTAGAAALRRSPRRRPASASISAFPITATRSGRTTSIAPPMAGIACRRIEQAVVFAGPRQGGPQLCGRFDAGLHRADLCVQRTEERQARHCLCERAHGRHLARLSARPLRRTHQPPPGNQRRPFCFLGHGSARNGPLVRPLRSRDRSRWR